MANERLTFIYRNHRGEISERIVSNPSFIFSFSEYHSEHSGDRNWLLVAWDCEKNAFRDFKIDDILTPIRTYVQPDADTVRKQELAP